MYQFPVSPVTKQVSIMSYLLSLHHLAQGEAIRRTRVWNEKKPDTFTRWFRKRKNATFVVPAVPDKETFRGLSKHIKGYQRLRDEKFPASPFLSNPNGEIL